MKYTILIMIFISLQFVVINVGCCVDPAITVLSSLSEDEILHAKFSNEMSNIPDNNIFNDFKDSVKKGKEIEFFNSLIIENIKTGGVAYSIQSYPFDGIDKVKNKKYKFWPINY